MKNFENVELPQDKFGLHQTCTIYCGVVALSIAYLVGFLKKSCEELLWKNAEPDSRSLRYICAFQPPRDGSARLCLNWSGCWLSFGNEFGSPGFTSSWECNRKKTMSAIVCSTNFVWATQLLMPIETFAAFLGRMDLVNALADIGSKN